VQDEIVVRVPQVTGRDTAQELAFCLLGSAGPHQPRTVGNAEHVGVDGNHGLSEGDVEDDAGALGAYPGKRFESLAPGRHLASETRLELAADAD
jgi:hypothetical protein